MQTIYQVTISPFEGSTSGFIDNVKPWQYLEEIENAGDTVPEDFNLTLSLQKTTENLRWFFIEQNLALMANPYVLNVTAVGAAIDTPATSFTFEIYFERDAAVTTVDADNNVYNGADAVQYAIASILAIAQNFQTEIYDPTLTTAYQNGTQTASPGADRMDRRVEVVSVPALSTSAADALSNVTVTVLSNASW
jgi:hypothetical protein